MSGKSKQIEGSTDGRKSCASSSQFAASTSACPPSPPGRDHRPGRRGRFLAGHKENITTGIATDRVPDYLVDELDRFIAGSLVDEGDANDIPTRRRSQLEYRARLHRRILQLDAALDQRGLVDKRNKLRTAWLTQLQSLIAAAVRIDNLLGLARHPKDAGLLDLSAADYAARQAVNETGGSQHETPEQGDAPGRPVEPETDDSAAG